MSGPRIRDELLDLLAEGEAPAAVELLRGLGLDVALHPDLHADAELVASAKLGAVETGADPALAALAALCVAPRWRPTARRRIAGVGRGRRSAAWVDRLGLPAGARDAVLRAADTGAGADAGALADCRGLRSCARCSTASRRRRSRSRSRSGRRREPVLDYVSRLSGTRLEIDGADLLAAGLPESPALGRALEATLARKLDGEVDGARRGASRGDRDRARWGVSGTAADPRPVGSPPVFAVDLPGAAVRFSTRGGGVSDGPYESLNLGRPDR